MPADSSEVAITINAIDEASDVIEGVQGNLEDMEAAAGDMSGAMGEMADSAGTATGALNDTGDSLDGVAQGSTLSMNGFMGLSSVMRTGILDYERTEMMQLRIQTATISLEKAQTAYNNAVKKYGENSSQAQLALQTLNVDQARLNDYQEKATLQYVLMAAQIPMVIGEIGRMAEGFGALSGVFGGASDAIAGFAGALGPVGLAIIALVAVGLILYEAWTNDWGGIREIVGGAVKDIQEALTGFASWLGSLGSSISTALGGVASWLKSNWQDLLIGALTGPVGLAMEAWKDNWGGIQTTVTSALAPVTEALGNFQKTVGDAFGQVATAIQTQHPVIAAALDSYKDLITGNWTALWGDLGKVVTLAFTSLQQDFSSLTAPILAAFSSFGTQITAVFSGVGGGLGGITAAIAKPFQDAGAAINTALSSLPATVSSGLSSLGSAVTSALSGASTWFEGLQKGWDSVVTAASNAWDQVKGTVTAQFPVIGQVIQTGMDALQGNWGKAWQDLQAIPGLVLKQIQGDIVAPLAAIGTGIATDLGQAVAGARQTFSTIVDAITTPLDNIADAISSKFPALAELIQGGTDILKGDWVGGMQKLADAIPGIFDTIGSTIMAALSKVGEVIATGMTTALQAARTAFDAFVNALSSNDPFKALLNLFTSSLSALDAAGSGAFKGTQAAVTSATSSIAASLTSGSQSWMAPIASFINWFIGGSVWPETWQNAQSVIQNFGPAAVASITTAMTQLEAVVQSALTKLATSFSSGVTQIEAQIRSGALILSTLFQPVVTVLQDCDQSWMTFVNDILTQIPIIKGTFQDFMKWFQPFWTDQFQAIVDTTTSSLNLIVDDIRNASSDMTTTWHTTVSEMASDTKAYFDTIVAEIESAVDAIIARLNAARHQISSGSIWPDMLTDMLGQTRTTMGQIQGVFNQSIAGTGGIVPLLQSIKPNIAPAASSTATQSFTIPVAVYLDGQQISTLTQKRLVRTLYQDAGRSRRTNIVH